MQPLCLSLTPNSTVIICSAEMFLLAVGLGPVQSNPVVKILLNRAGNLLTRKGKHGFQAVCKKNPTHRRSRWSHRIHLVLV